MASGILGQVAAGSSLEDLYVCPANTIATLKVIVANRGGATSFRIAVQKNGEADSNKQLLASNTPIAANEPGSTVSFIVSGGDVIRVAGGTSNVSFTATGEERAQ